MKNHRSIKIAAIVLVAYLVVFGVFAIVRFNQPETENVGMEQSTQPATSENALIVYLTRTGNTEAVAQMINDKIGGTLTELEVETPYPEGYQEQVDQVASENARNYLPSLKTKIENIEQYDTIFLGAPTWGMQLPPPMKSFLDEYNLSGKTVIPFNTNGGYGIGTSFNDIRDRCNDCTILEGFSVEGGHEREGELFVMVGEKEIAVRTSVHEWLQGLGLTRTN